MKISPKDNLMAKVGTLAGHIVERAPTKEKSAEILDAVTTKNTDSTPGLAPLITEFKSLEKAVQAYNKGIIAETPEGATPAVFDLPKVLGTIAGRTLRSVVNVDLKRDGGIDGKKLRTAILSEVGRAVVGHEDVIELTLIAQLCKGHILLEGPVGVGKTHLAKSFSSTAGLEFGRQQFVADLLPGDIVGAEVPDPATRELKPKFGQIAETSVFLADEINRAPPKAQGALLEAMAEGQVTVGRETRKLDEFFTVIATQNPDSHDGTYPLTEANRDRFMFKVTLDRPTPDQQLQIMDLTLEGAPKLRQVVNEDMLKAARKGIQNVRIEKPVREYIIEIVRGTWPDVSEVGDVKGKIAGDGASERATAGLLQAARARAFLRGRDYVTPEDVSSLAPEVLRHRVELQPTARANTKVDDVVDSILQHVEAKMADRFSEE